MMGSGKEWIFRIVETQLAVRPGLKTAVHDLDMGETLRKERGAHMSYTGCIKVFSIWEKGVGEISFLRRPMRS